MQPEYLIDSTGQELGSSDGVSVQNSMRRWSRRSLIAKRNETEPARTPADYITQEAKALDSQHLDTQGIYEYISENEALARAFSHWAIDLMPREGLTELVEQVLQMLVFYTERKPAPLSLPSSGTSFKAKLRPTVTRPTFSITEDE